MRLGPCDIANAGAPRSRIFADANSGMTKERSGVSPRSQPPSPGVFGASMNTSLATVFVDCRDKPGNDTESRRQPLTLVIPAEEPGSGSPDAIVSPHGAGA